MTASARAVTAYIEEALEITHYYMSAYDRGAYFECELLLLEGLNSGVRLTFPLPVAALRGAPNWPAIRALSLALTM